MNQLKTRLGKSPRFNPFASASAIALIWVIVALLVASSLFNFLIEIPLLLVLTTIIALPLSFFAGLNRSFAKIVLLLIPASIVVSSALTFARVGIPLVVAILILFLAIAVVPVAWARLRTDEFEFRTLLVKSIFPGVVLLLATPVVLVAIIGVLRLLTPINP